MTHLFLALRALTAIFLLIAHTLCIPPTDDERDLTTLDAYKFILVRVRVWFSVAEVLFPADATPTATDAIRDTARTVCWSFPFARRCWSDSDVQVLDVDDLRDGGDDADGGLSPRSRPWSLHVCGALCAAQ